MDAIGFCFAHGISSNRTQKSTIQWNKECARCAVCVHIRAAYLKLVKSTSEIKMNHQVAKNIYLHRRIAAVCCERQRVFSMVSMLIILLYYSVSVFQFWCVCRFFFSSFFSAAAAVAVSELKYCP